MAINKKETGKISEKKLSAKKKKTGKKKKITEAQYNDPRI